MRGEGRERSCLTSVLKEASSSELDSSTSGGFLISLDSFSALTFSPLVLPLSLAGFLSEKEEDEVRGEVLGALLDPLELLFFCFLALGLGESAVAGLLLEDLGALEEGMAATPIFLPGKSRGQKSLVGYGP